MFKADLSICNMLFKLSNEAWIDGSCLESFSMINVTYSMVAGYQIHHTQKLLVIKTGTLGTSVKIIMTSTLYNTTSSAYQTNICMLQFIKTSRFRCISCMAVCDNEMFQAHTCLTNDKQSCILRTALTYTHNFILVLQWFQFTDCRYEMIRSWCKVYSHGWVCLIISFSRHSVYDV